MTDKKTFCLVALGCDKNTVDSELMLSELKKNILSLRRCSMQI